MQAPTATLTRQSAPLQQMAGAATLIVLLGVAAVGTGLGPAGWVAGLGYAAGFHLLLTGAVRRAGEATLGPAGIVTLTRAVLVGVLTALVVDGLFTDGPAPVAALVTLATVPLVLDAVDGAVARRTGTSTPLGARFDMETDAVLLLVLSVHVATILGPWVLAVGLMRYAFVAAGAVLPHLGGTRWLSGTLPPRFSAKVVAAAQGIVLVAAASGLVPFAGPLVGVALLALTWSFARDVWWLWRHR